MKTVDIWFFISVGTVKQNTLYMLHVLPVDCLNVLFIMWFQLYDLIKSTKNRVKMHI